MEKRTKVALATALMVGIMGVSGTFAWTSISQRAINEVSMTKQPGGRVHDDYEGIRGLDTTTEGDINKNIYAENYSNKPLYVRIKLTEFFESGLGAGQYMVDSTDHIMKPTSDNQATVLPNSGLDNAALSDRTSWPAYLPNGLLSNGSPSELRQVIQWSLGDTNDDRKVFMPTFNQNNMDISADVTGEAIDELTWKKNLYYEDLSKVLNGTFEQWSLGETYTSTLIKNNGDTAAPVETPGVTHTAKETVVPTNGGYMTMTDWLSQGKPTGYFWVHDSDGWFYWATELEPYSATSLVLDRFHVVVPQDDFYYAINVISDFSTEEDVVQWSGKTLNADDLLTAIQKAK
ncbi:MAG: hypothetical protein ACTIDE_15660 [Carnobacterium maltaromaticum]